MSEAQKEAFSITNDKAAEWAMRKVSELRADTKAWKAHYDAQFAAIKESNEQDEAYFLGLLERYFSTVKHKVTATTEKYILPYGEMILKKQEPEFTIDNDELVDWLKQDPEYLVDFVKEQKPKAAWGEFKKHVEIIPITEEDPYTHEKVIKMAVADISTGEVVKGVTVTPREPVFDIKVKEKKSNG